MAEFHPFSHLQFVCTLIDDHPMLVDISGGRVRKTPLKTAPKRQLLDKNGNEKASKADAKLATNVAVFSRSGKHIITGTSNGWVNVIDTASSEIIYSTRPLNSAIWSLRLSNSGRDMVLNSSDSVIRTIHLPDLDIAELDTDKFSMEVEHKFQDLVNKTSWNHVTFSSSGDYVAATKSMASDIYVWERSLGSLVKILEGPKEELKVVEWHPSRPFVAACGMETGRIYLWSIIAPQKWSALAPDFVEVEENVEYIEKEDEFDIHPLEEIHRRRLDLEDDEEIDVITIPFSERGGIDSLGGETFRMPVLLDIDVSDSEDEIIAVGPGTLRRRSPGEGRQWMNGVQSDDEGTASGFNENGSNAGVGVKRSGSKANKPNGKIKKRK
jgi:COMPASS component SWD1